MSKITLSISIPEVVYDVQNKTYLTGRSRAGEANHREVALMQANDDEENINQILRSIQSGISNVRLEFGEWMESDGASADNSTLPDRNGDIVLEAQLPGNYNMAMTQPLTDAIHQYLVAYAVAEWFTITDKEDASEYEELAETARKAVGRSLSERRRPRRPASKP